MSGTFQRLIYSDTIGCFQSLIVEIDLPTYYLENTDV